MKLKLEEILSIANEIADLAHCDLDCFCDDYSAGGYVERADKIKRLAQEIEAKMKQS